MEIPLPGEARDAALARGAGGPRDRIRCDRRASRKTTGRLKAADHLQFQVYVSDDLIHWQVGEGRTTVVSVVDKGDGTEAVVERDNVPLGDVPRRFLKLVVGRK